MGERGSNEANGAELWQSDGTAAGTLLVKDIWPGPDSSGTCKNKDWAQLGTFVYFGAVTELEGCALWRTDRTAAGTTLDNVGYVMGGAHGCGMDRMSKDITIFRMP